MPRSNPLLKCHPGARKRDRVQNNQRTAAMQSFLYMEGESMGLKSQLLGSIMPARKRFVAMLALSICPLVRISLFSTPSSGDSDAAPATPWLGYAKN